MNHKNLKLFSIFILIIVFTISAGLFTYWINGTNLCDSDNENSITVGVGSVVTTTLNLNEVQAQQGVLVPAGFEKPGKSVNKIVINYEVSLKEVEIGSAGSEFYLSVTAKLPNKLLNMYIFQSTPNIIVEGDKVNVDISITIKEPTNKQEYEMIADKTLPILISFSAVNLNKYE